jgi:hypothetical protein
LLRSSRATFKCQSDTDGRTISPLPRALARRQDAGRLYLRDANGQAMAFVYSRDGEAEARQAKVLTTDEARRVAANIARLPELLGKADRD